MNEEETRTKSGKIEKRIFIDSGSFVIYGYEGPDGAIEKKYRLVLKGINEKKSFFIIPTGEKRNLALNAEYEEDVYILKDGKAVKVSEILDKK